METTTNDYIRAAKIVATCRAERLPIVLGLLEQAGMEIERNGDATDYLIPGTMDALNMLCDIPKHYAEHFDETSDAEQWGKIGDDGMLFIQVRELRKIAEERDHAIALAVDSGKKVDELMKSNGEIKRQMKAADAKIKKQKHQLDEAHRATECQADCKNRKNHNACRTCTRYPHAKDKYEVAE